MHRPPLPGPQLRPRLKPAHGPLARPCRRHVRWRAAPCRRHPASTASNTASSIRNGRTPAPNSCANAPSTSPARDPLDIVSEPCIRCSETASPAVAAQPRKQPQTPASTARRRSNSRSARVQRAKLNATTAIASNAIPHPSAGSRHPTHSSRSGRRSPPASGATGTRGSRAYGSFRSSSSPRRRAGARRE